MAVVLPPPPINDKPGSYTWMEWYRQLRAYVSTSGSVPWYIINFSGSNITDIAQRDHGNLQGLQGGTTGERYHLTAAQAASIGVGNHNNLNGIQGGGSTERYHLTADQYNAIESSLEVYSTTATTVLPTTATIFSPSVTSVRATGITYTAASGEITLTSGGVYTIAFSIAATASATGNVVYVSPEVDTGSGFSPLQYATRQFDITKTTVSQLSFTETRYFAKGAKLRYKVWSNTATVNVVTQDVVASTITLPAYRLLVTQ